MYPFVLIVHFRFLFKSRMLSEDVRTTVLPASFRYLQKDEKRDYKYRSHQRTNDFVICFMVVR